MDRQSYEIQIRELAETSHGLEQENIELNGRCEKLRQFIVKQNVLIVIIRGRNIETGWIAKENVSKNEREIRLVECIVS